MDKLLVLQTSHGLGNRLCAMATYSAIARHLGRTLRVYWPVDRAVADTHLRDVFSDDCTLTLRQWQELAKGRSHRAIEIRYGMAPGADFHRDADRIAALPDVSEDVLSVTQSCMFCPPFMDEVRFHRDFREYLCGLRPVREIGDTVDAFARRHGIAPENPRVSGLHIRRTDRRESIAASTDERFREVIRAELDRDPAARFFLATDCRDTERRFRRGNGDRIITFEKRYDRSDPARPTSLRSAVVELLLLSRTHHIYGSYASSFSKVASVIRGIKFDQVGFEARPRW